ncbi:UBP1-associated proteins 1A-like [Setaria italica]|uniref:UBP1-associated proteins 1A-like n=1 Tax=Setaria italica TaxID=4555 RepID=UPI000BE4F28A|nr:UBP1-associated proteins 1A-like [Setaria italica]
MGRKRKRPRKVEPPAERVHRESTGEEVDGEDSVTTNPPMAGPSVSVEREEVSEAAAAEEDEDIGELLEPFTRDELLELLTDACLRSPALLARVAASAASDAAPRRLFVHGLGPGATSAALAAAFAPFGAFDECHAVADRATGRCRGYGFLAALGPVARSSSSDRKLFVDNVPERAAHDDLRGLFSKFGEIEEGPLGADRATGLFRGYAIFLYKTPEGLRKALEEPTKVFDGCELQCRRAYRGSNPKHAAATPTDTGVQSNGGAVTAVLSSVQAKDLALTSKPSLLQLNQSVGLKAKGSSSATAIALFRQNVPAGGAGILGAAPVTTAVSSSLVHGTSSTPPSHCGAAIGHVGLNDAARAGASPMVSVIGSNNSASSLQVQGLGAAKNTMPPSLHPGQLSTRPGLIQHYLGR